MSNPTQISQAAAIIGALGGKKGGKSKSPQKRKASRQNMAKARERLAQIIKAGKEQLDG
jgi:hypothetical protein